MKRFFLILVAVTLVITTFASESGPALIPEPQKYEISRTEYIPFDAVTLVCPDAAAATWAKKHLKQWYNKFAPQVVCAQGNTASMGAEEYRLNIDKSGVKIEANTLQGVRYALYTLRQLAIVKRNVEKLEGWIVPHAKIEDKPDMEWRGMHICWFHENQPWEVERMIRLAAYYKLNYAVIEPWGTFQSKSVPWFGWDDGTMTHKEIKRLKAIADDLGITLIPQLNVFGHASNSRIRAGKHATLDLKPEYQQYFEPFGGWNWCLSNPHTKEVQKKLIKELYEVFGCPPYFHIGCDEASIPSCPDCVKSSYSTLFKEQVKEMSEYVNSLGARTLMWHDMLLEQNDARWKSKDGSKMNSIVAKGTKETASVVNELPKDVIICDWYYRNPRESYPNWDYFKSFGFDVIACPWDRKGTADMITKAPKYGLKGILGTIWNHHYGLSLLDIYYKVGSLTWNSDAALNVYGNSYNARYVFHTHLRHVGWDMKIKDWRQSGLYHYEVVPEPTLYD